MCGAVVCNWAKSLGDMPEEDCGRKNKSKYCPMCRGGHLECTKRDSHKGPELHWWWLGDLVLVAGGGVVVVVARWLEDHRQTGRLEQHV